MDISVVEHQISRADSVIDSDEGFAESPGPTEALQIRESDREREADHRQASSTLSPFEDENAAMEVRSQRKRKRTESPGPQIDSGTQARIITEETADLLELLDDMTKEDAQRLSIENTKPEAPALESTNPFALHSSEADDEEAETKSPFKRKRTKSPDRQVASLAQAKIIAKKTRESIEPEIAKVLKSTNTATSIPQEIVAQTADELPATKTHSESPSLTLAEEALSSMEHGVCSKTRRVHLREGDVLIVLDVKNLGLSCRIRSEDLKKASVWFTESLRSASASNGPNGVRYLYTLQASTQSEESPQLVLTDLTVLKQACVAKIYTRPMQAQDSRSEKSSAQGFREPAKEDGGAAVHIVRSDTEQRPDWLKAYETFFRIISHTDPTQLQFNRKDINDALPHISAVATLASLYGTTSYSSAITSAFTVLFARFDEKNMLWGSIAGKPLQWLIISTNLEKAAIFKEAFVHTVSAYPSLCGGGREQQLPKRVRMQVSQRAKEMQYRRIQINNDLLALSVSEATDDPVSPSTDYLAYSVLVYFKEWIAEHLRQHSKGGSGQTTSAFCDHSNGDCVRTADFYRLLAAGDYLPDTQVFEFLTRAPCDRGDNARELGSNKKESVRNILKTIKAKAADIVKPIVASTLCWNGSASLSYLTSLAVEDDDYPWEPEIKQKDGITDSEESEEDDMD